MDINNSYALVTGSSSGIGYEYARELASRGYSLIMVSNEEAINEKADEIRQVYPNLDIVPVVSDLGRQEAAKELYTWSQEKGYTVEILVNNAGVFHCCDFLEDSERFNSLILNLHVYTPSMLVYYFGQDMAKRGHGYILNMSSVSSNYGIQCLSTYTSTKAFMRYFSRALHIELKRKGVKVTCVRPGAVATKLYNLEDNLMKLGVNLGVITPAEKLARKGIKAMFKGKSMIAPGLFTKLLECVAYIPLWMLLLIRRFGWY